MLTFLSVFFSLILTLNIKDCYKKIHANLPMGTKNGNIDANFKKILELIINF